MNPIVGLYNLFTHVWLTCEFYFYQMFHQSSCTAMVNTLQTIFLFCFLLSKWLNRCVSASEKRSLTGIGVCSWLVLTSSTWLRIVSSKQYIRVCVVFSHDSGREYNIFITNDPDKNYFCFIFHSWITWYDYHYNTVCVRNTQPHLTHPKLVWYSIWCIIRIWVRVQTKFVGSNHQNWWLVMVINGLNKGKYIY